MESPVESFHWNHSPFLILYLLSSPWLQEFGEDDGRTMRMGKRILRSLCLVFGCIAFASLVWYIFELMAGLEECCFVIYIIFKIKWLSSCNHSLHYKTSSLDHLWPLKAGRQDWGMLIGLTVFMGPGCPWWKWEKNLGWLGKAGLLNEKKLSSLFFPEALGHGEKETCSTLHLANHVIGWQRIRARLSWSSHGLPWPVSHY